MKEHEKWLLKANEDLISGDLCRIKFLLLI